MPSELLHRRIPAAHIALNPENARFLNIADGAKVQFTVDGNFVEVLLHVDDQVPIGVALVPRSLGMPLSSPTPIEIKIYE
jgi:formylmethanofuran dehydrogenase subunit D